MKPTDDSDKGSKPPRRGAPAGPGAPGFPAAPLLTRRVLAVIMFAIANKTA